MAGWKDEDCTVNNETPLGKGVLVGVDDGLASGEPGLFSGK